MAARGERAHLSLSSSSYVSVGGGGSGGGGGGAGGGSGGGKGAAAAAAGGGGGGDRKHRKRRAPRAERDLVKLISVADASSGLVLFEQSYRWHDTAQSTSLGNLVLSFYQFAREIDAGEISSIQFETSAAAGGGGGGAGSWGASATGGHRRALSNASGHHAGALGGAALGGAGGGGGGGGRRAQLSGHRESMTMVCRRSSTVIVSVFYDTRGTSKMQPGTVDRLEEFATQCHARFEEQFSELLASPNLRSTIARMSAESNSYEDSELKEQVWSQFASFKATIEDLRVQCFVVPSQSALTSPVSGKSSSTAASSRPPNGNETLASSLRPASRAEGGDGETRDAAAEAVALEEGKLTSPIPEEQSESGAPESQTAGGAS